jgi:uncharacterized membrane protein YkoI
MNTFRTATAFVCILAIGNLARADEEKIALDKLPAKVKEAVKAKFPDAELVSAEKENENGKTVFEVAIKNKGNKLEVTLTEDGKILSIEKEIAAKDAPKAVMEALEKKYPKAEIKKVEEITKGDKVTYEFLITAGDKKLEVVFDAQGKLVEEEDKTKKDK